MNSKVRNFRTVCGVIAFFMFFFMLGAVGAVENNAVPLLPGAIPNLRVAGSVGFVFLPGRRVQMIRRKE